MVNFLSPQFNQLFVCGKSLDWIFTSFYICVKGLLCLFSIMSHLYLVPGVEASEYYSTGVRSTENAGVDLYVPATVIFAPGEKKLVSMAVRAVMIEEDALQNYWMVPRSSISKTGLMMLNSVGVIDKSYRGELMAFLWNTTGGQVVVEKGQRLVQIVARHMGDIVETVVVDKLPESARGDGGFGSSGR
jgi:dUTP pyrophosphatase